MRFFFVLTLFTLSLAVCAGKYAPAIPHPRLHFSRDAGKRFAAFLKTDIGKSFRAKMLYDADELLKMPETAFRPQSDGKRILAFAYEKLRRVHLLGMAYRLSNNEKYADRCVEEVLSVCAMKDWNPSHFLDTSELALAVGTCYDWFYSKLSPAERKIIEQALLKKAFLPAVPEDTRFMMTSITNWTQFCNASLTAAAIAVYESCPDVAEKLISRAINNHKEALTKIYAPAGTYGEGPTYWEYGTSFSSLLLSVLESTYGTDFGIGSAEGFNKTLDFFSMTLSPSGKHYAWGDGGEEIGYRTLFAIYFLSRFFHTQDCILPEFEQQWEKLLAERKPYRTDDTTAASNRFIPLIALNYQPPVTSSKRKTAYYSGAEAPVQIAMFRNQDAFFGIKAGFPLYGHGHMDTGCFIYDAAYVRWFRDLGAVHYAVAERNGIDLWNGKQDSSRWSLFMLGPQSHNIIAIPNIRQSVTERGRLSVSGPGCVTLDLDGVYSGKWTRKAQFKTEDSSLEITDTLSGFPAGTVLLFQLASQMQGGKESEDVFVLRDPKSGAELEVKMKASHASAWIITDDSKPHSKAEAGRGNIPGLRMFRYPQTIKKEGEQIQFHTTMRIKKKNGKSVFPLEK